MKIPINKVATNEEPNCLNPANPVLKLPFLVLTTSIINNVSPSSNGPANKSGPITTNDETLRIIPSTSDKPKNVQTFPLICSLAKLFERLS